MGSFGMEWWVLKWYEVVWFGLWLGLDGVGLFFLMFDFWCGLVWFGSAWFGLAWLGLAWLGLD
jgi:hypothetical protein